MYRDMTTSESSLNVSTVYSETVEDLGRSEDLYLRDGTVVLQAQETRFRVSSSVLSRQSAVFEGLFSLPQPADAESHDGFPLITLHGDTPADVRDFLLTIIDAKEANSFMKDPYACVAVLQLSHKYEAAETRRRVLNFLDTLFPSTAPRFEMWLEDNPSVDLQAPFTEPRHLVALLPALEHAAPIFLPFVLWRLQRLTRSLDGISERDYMQDGRTVRPLTQTIIEGFAQARIALTKAGRRCTYAAVLKRNRFCTSPERCDNVRARYRLMHEDDRRYLDPLTLRPYLSFCKQCEGSVDLDAELSRPVIWDQLTSMMKLPPWEDMRNFTFS